MPIRTLRSLVVGDHAALRSWLAAESALRLAEARRDARLDLAALEALGARIVTPADPDWPPGFADLPDPPAFLTVRGTLPRAGIAVIGARDVAEEERAYARALAAALERPIVAGLAPGIDDAAHRGALDAGQPTVAYLGSGLPRAEDPVLADAIVAGGGGMVSEYGPAMPGTPWTRKRRDRLQAAHAEAVVLVVTDAADGAMHTIRFARTYGRPRFALDAEASGNRLALAEGALPLPWETRAAARIITASL